MEIRAWTPDGNALAELDALADAAIYDRLLAPRSFEGERPPSLERDLEHCSKPFILRDLGRDVMEVGPVRRDRVERERAPRSTAPARVAVLSRQVGRIVFASSIAKKSQRAVRAMLRLLLRQPLA